MLSEPTGIGLVELVKKVRVDQAPSAVIGLRATQGAHTQYKAIRPRKVAATSRNASAGAFAPVQASQPRRDFSPRMPRAAAAPAADRAVPAAFGRSNEAARVSGRAGTSPSTCSGPGR